MAARCSNLQELLSYRSSVVRNLETDENFLRQSDMYPRATELQLEASNVTSLGNK
jgi:hypothetical protein